MARPAALGFDVGTSAVKAGLLRLDSHEPMLTVSRPYPTARPAPGWVWRVLICWGLIHFPP